MKKTPASEKNNVVFCILCREKSKQLRFPHMQQSLRRRRASARRRIVNGNQSTNPYCKETSLDKGISSYHPGASSHSLVSSTAHHIYES